MNAETTVTIAVGRTQDNGRAYLTLRLGNQPGRWQTIDHEPIENPRELAITGLVKGPGGYESGGQNRDEYRPENLAHPETLIVEPNDIARILEIWDRWHLNTMKPGCRHQPEEPMRETVDQFPRAFVYPAPRHNPYTEEPYHWVSVDPTAPAFTMSWSEHYNATHPPAPECTAGYRWGSAWLTDPLPAEVEAEALALFRKYESRRGSL